MLTIDGSRGEGGGQILRSSLALSIVTGTPVRIENIRAGRAKPGLMRQHLTAVNSAAAICGGSLDGARIGSPALTFKPGRTKAGDYQFSIGTAGSTTLVLQTVLLPLLLADEPSRITLEGGTHNPHAPPFDFLAKAYLPQVCRMGPAITATLERCGFYPAGGGRFTVEISPVSKLGRIELMERGEAKGHRARAIVANLGRHVGERELRVVRNRLNWGEPSLLLEEAPDAPGQGNVLMLELAYENVTEVFTAFGEVNRAAEAVAMSAVDQCRKYLAATAPVGEYLTDQLMLPMAIAGAGCFRSTGLSLHAQTHVELIHAFLGARIRTQPGPGGSVDVLFD